MTGIVYNTTATFKLESTSNSHSTIFGEYTVRSGCPYNFLTLRKGQTAFQLNTLQLIELRKIIDRIIKDLETGVS